MGALLNVTGLRVKQSEIGDFLIRDFNTGIICAYDKQDMNKNILVFFSGAYNVSFKTDEIVANGLSIAGGNMYGSLSVTGGSDEYVYSIIGF